MLFRVVTVIVVINTSINIDIVTTCITTSVIRIILASCIIILMLTVIAPMIMFLIVSGQLLNSDIVLIIAATPTYYCYSPRFLPSILLLAILLALLATIILFGDLLVNLNPKS